MSLRRPNPPIKGSSAPEEEEEEIAACFPVPLSNYDRLCAYGSITADVPAHGFTNFIPQAIDLAVPRCFF